MIPLKTIELRAGFRVEMLTGTATVKAIHADNGGGYAVDLQYTDGVLHTVRHAAADDVWTVDVR